NSFDLDEDFIKEKQTETRQLHKLLDDNVFSDNTSEIDISKVNTKQIEPPISELDKEHQSLFYKVIEKESWDINTIQNYCKNFDLMFDGAMEVINEWAIEITELPLIDIDDLVYIDVEVAKELINDKR
ncbi:MAG: hypothetical protein HQL46_13225, partial [Gammaproteobacteria bacterium]|nr:hypothetical protein [Gammaproteobacteria bacterium]